MKRFKLSDKSLWYIKINCYCSKGAWHLLYRLANEKKSPVGYRPFAAACIKHGQPPTETEKYVEKISDAEEKYALFVELKLWRRAAEVANKLRDPYKLQDVSKLGYSLFIN